MLKLLYTTLPSIYIKRSVTNLKNLAMIPQIQTTDPDAVHFAIDTLKLGGIIALPTDTVYGIGCCATNVEAINKLYEIKTRNENKPIAICVGREVDIQKWAHVEHLPKGLLTSLLPGPVTLVLKCANKLDKSLNFNGKIGVRIPDYDFIRQVCNGLNVPLALTSANLSGEPSSVTVGEFKTIWDKLSGIIDGGILGIDDLNRQASTVIDLCEPGYYKITRNGIAFQETCETLKYFNLKEVVKEA